MRAPPFALAPGVELRVNGQLQRVKSISDAGAVELVCPIRRTSFSFAIPELIQMHLDGLLEPVNAIRVSHVVSGRPKPGKLERAAQERVTRRMVYGRAASIVYPVGPKSERLRAVIAEVAERISDTKPPSPFTVYRWVHRYVASGYDTAVFMQDADVTRTRRPRVLTDELATRLRENIQSLLGANEGATLNGVTNLALAKTAKDMGYIKFVTKEGTEEIADEFVLKEQVSLSARLAKRKTGRPEASA